MNKFLFLIFFYFLCSSTIANAGIDEAGSGNWCQLYNKGIKLAEENQKNKIKKNKKYSIIYAACEIDGLAYQSYFGNNLEKLKKKTYKKCMKRAKKSNLKDCYIFSLNGEVLWQKKYDWDKGAKRAKAELAEAKPLKEKQAQLDKRPGRFFEDQPDVSDDYQIHFIYMLAADGKDREYDINGWIEKRIKTVNKKFLKMSAKTKKSNGIGHQFKLDMTKEGKLDVTFVRMNVLKKQLDNTHAPESLVYRYLKEKGFDNPKKVYATFTGFNHRDGNDVGGEGGVPYTVIFTPAVKSYGQPDMDLVILHELFHTQGAAYACGKRTYEGTHVKGSDVLGKGILSTKIDSKNDTYYRHDIEGCPDLAKSVFVTPTAKDSWDPYDVFCRKKKGNFTHPNLYGQHICKNSSAASK